MSDKPPYKFYVDAKEYSSPDTSLTGAEIKKIANVPAQYQLYLEEEGNKPDKAISDGEGVNIKEGKEKHFFAVPPATFGYQ